MPFELIEEGLNYADIQGFFSVKRAENKGTIEGQEEVFQFSVNLGNLYLQIGVACIGFCLFCVNLS